MCAHLKELDRSTGRRYCVLGGSAPLSVCVWRGVLLCMAGCIISSANSVFRVAILCGLAG
jgi:hypothetical protein